MQTPRSRRSDWLPQALLLALVALIGTVPFWLTDLDIRVAALFWHPELDNPWVEAEGPLWSFLYVAAPLAMGVVLLGGLLVLAGGRLWTGMRRLRPYAVLAIATALIGPGLLVNGLIKDQWGRPRPHQVEALGGARDYLPPLKPGEPGKGKSFPSGHSSVGFMLGVFFLIWRRRRPRLAWMALAAAIAFGLLLGIGRMAAGDHFLSDVIWSGVFVYGIALLLYYGILRIPRQEAAIALSPAVPVPPLRHPWRVGLALGAAASGMLALVLLATPVNQNHREVVRAGEFPGDPRVLRVAADQADLILYRIGGPDRAAIKLEARGFGLPTSRVEQTLSEESGALILRIRHRGVFTERDTRLVVGLEPGQWDRVEVRVGTGNIRVQAHPEPGPVLDLASANGRVQEVPPE
jgi:lipid A 4'-phosphatase